MRLFRILRPVECILSDKFRSTTVLFGQDWISSPTGPTMNPTVSPSDLLLHSANVTSVLHRSLRYGSFGDYLVTTVRGGWALKKHDRVAKRGRGDMCVACCCPNICVSEEFLDGPNGDASSG